MDTITRGTKVKKWGISQSQVAEILKIDQSTVSCALKGLPNVSKETREKVLSTCKKYNYRPNYFSRALRSSQVSTIGIVVSTLEDPYMAQLLHHLAFNLSENGYDMLVRAVKGGEKDKQKDSILELLDQRVGGVLVLSTYGSLYNEIHELLGNSIPLVVIGATSQDTAGVTSNKFNGALEAGKHLISIGRHRLAAIMGAQVPKKGADSKLAGFDQASLEAGLPSPVHVIKSFSGNDNGESIFSSCYKTANLFLDKHRAIDGVLCNSDVWATALVCTCVERGLRVPEDLAIVGFDNIPQGRYTTVPLTTVQQPVKEIAKTAVNMLLSEINSFPSFIPETKILDCKLIIRKSTDPLWKPEQASNGDA